jgi:hypothetical protein
MAFNLKTGTALQNGMEDSDFLLENNTGTGIYASKN